MAELPGGPVLAAETGMDERRDHDEAIARLRAELDQRVRDARVLAEQLDALQREIERLRQRIADELDQ